MGAVLVPRLIEAGYEVAVLDLYLYGAGIFGEVHGHDALTEIKGDIRDPATIEKAVKGCEAVIHLACISNDPSFELQPELGKSINYDAFRPLVRACKAAGVKRFIYASSSSVYGIKDDPEVTEDLPLDPLTDYSKFKALCEQVLEEEREPGFVTLTLRPATVCGYSPRQRLDVIVNILTNHAVNTGKIKVFGGSQLRPNIHIEDMVDLYLLCLEASDADIDGKVFNAGYQDHSVMELAEKVRKIVGNDVSLEVLPTDDLRSYQVSSQKIAKELRFKAKRSIEDAVRDMLQAFKHGKLPNSMDDSRYYNIKRMQEVSLD